MSNKPLIAAAIAGVLAGGLAVIGYNHLTGDTPSSGEQQKQPLYWVAPMDDSYRRDKPGKSPMGMDLVPVYEQNASNTDEQAGTVTISPAVENNMGVRTAPARKGQINTDISTVGYVKYDEDEIVHIHPRVEGWIEQQFVKAAGDPVEKGQPLYALYSPELVNAQEEYIIALRRNNAALISAARERLAALDIPEKVVAQISRQKEIVRTVTFDAPQSGFVNELNIRDGFFVQPGMTLMSIGQLDTVWVEAEVFERDAASVSAGMPVTMTVDAIKGKTWQGTVDYVAPALQSANRTLPVRLKFANPEHRLKPNMLADIHIDVPIDSQAVLVPNEAVIRTGSQNRVVLANGDGKFRSVAVTLGRAGKNDIEILDGVNEGERVVTSAQFLIDSESSKSSDFTRMGSSSDTPSAWAKGKIKAVRFEQRSVTIDHEPVEALDWPAMTMDFSVAEDVAIEKLAEGQSLHFEIGRTNGSPVVTGIHIMQQDGGAAGNTETNDHPQRGETQTQSSPDAVAVTGTITAVSTTNRTLTIDHDAVEAWNWPAMTMDFPVDKNVDMKKLAVGQSVHFEVTRSTDNAATVTRVHVMAPASNPSTQQPPQSDTKPKAVAVMGTLTAISPANRTVTVNHKPVEAWDWPAMTMDFAVDESISLDKLATGQSLHFEVTRDDNGALSITGIHILAKAEPGHNNAGHDSPPPL
ncbi:efflux RND transporter periplasmic adaptor subunit [Salinimonas sp. HHU 13199]|uniref:Efflux RND transporter periplasmic adaptor subunit n=1 Tax=Salinimonas profundi TaxID=2729140 RepID=A0ABR8LI21_9ALTE|nr:efflux RND transporter periplasmic adaptor subunit [Salinimonas profundi]MBD3584736.1 efflux RND transporter periplasmic adaptor subunit [Salinimonas profundi]